MQDDEAIYHVYNKYIDLNQGTNITFSDNQHLRT